MLFRSSQASKPKYSTTTTAYTSSGEGRYFFNRVNEAQLLEYYINAAASFGKKIDSVMYSIACTHVQEETIDYDKLYNFYVFLSSYFFSPFTTAHFRTESPTNGF